MATRTLIATLPPMVAGGVSTKARLLAGALARAGHEVTLAYYDPTGGKAADLTVFEPHRQVAVRVRRTIFEQNYTRLSDDWLRLIADNDRHVAVGGTVLIAHPMASAGIRHMIWCASDLEGDRASRQQAMPWFRRWPDRWWVAGALERQQAGVLAADNRVFGVSGDAVARLVRVAPRRRSEIGRLPIPVDTDFFVPAKTVNDRFRIGFAGRLDDPRKNAGLLFAALAEARRRGVDAVLDVTGGASPALVASIANHGLSDAVTFAGTLDRDGLRRFYQSLDLFVLSSWQEGLAIAALEAMACAIPVVSTDCGGPSDYVVSGENGFLTGFEPGDIADAIERTAADASDRADMAEAARATATAHYSMPAFAENLGSAWQETWGAAL